MRPAGFNPSATPDANKFIVGIENYRTLLSTTYRRLTMRTAVHGAIILVGAPALVYKLMSSTTPGGSHVLHDQMIPLKEHQKGDKGALPPAAATSTVGTPVGLNHIDVFGPRTPLSSNRTLGPYSELVLASRVYNENPDRQRNWMPDPTHFLVRSLPAAPASEYGAIARRAQAALSAYAESRDYPTMHAEGAHYHQTSLDSRAVTESLAKFNEKLNEKPAN